jgi:hypothetical protein
VAQLPELDHILRGRSAVVDCVYVVQNTSPRTCCTFYTHWTMSRCSQQRTQLPCIPRPPGTRSPCAITSASPARSPRTRPLKPSFEYARPITAIPVPVCSPRSCPTTASSYAKSSKDQSPRHPRRVRSKRHTQAFKFDATLGRYAPIRSKPRDQSATLDLQRNLYRYQCSRDASNELQYQTTDHDVANRKFAQYFSDQMRAPGLSAIHRAQLKDSRPWSSGSKTRQRRPRSVHGKTLWKPVAHKSFASCGFRAAGRCVLAKVEAQENGAHFQVQMLDSVAGKMTNDGSKHQCG